MIQRAINKLILSSRALPLSKEPAFPDSHTQESLFQLLANFQIDGSTSSELEGYLAQDFLRFVHTLNLIPAGEGKLLEIGSNPYFTSLLIKKFTRYALTCTNYFGGELKIAVQEMCDKTNGERIRFEYFNHNIELSEFPMQEEFDVVLFCEVIEHLTMDPLLALSRIKSTLKPDGYLILSTPNVARLENIARMLSGANIYDPYSGYGPYGRHNREYNRHELVQLLDHAGFEVEEIFTSDVHLNGAGHFFSLRQVVPLVWFRRHDLGQYLFVRARNSRPLNPRKPGWLYRSYPQDQLDS